MLENVENKLNNTHTNLNVSTLYVRMKDVYPYGTTIMQSGPTLVLPICVSLL